MLKKTFPAIAVVCLLLNASVNAGEAELENALRLVLPPSIPAVVGEECNIYFDNVVLVPMVDAWIFDVDCNRGRQQSERWTWVPTKDDVGDQPIRIDIRDGLNKIVATAKTTVRVVAADRRVDEPISMLCIGDSLTQASVYTGRLLDLCNRPGNPKLKLIGTHWPGNEAGPNRHEGYGGWTAKRFATHFNENARMGHYKKRGSPFLYLNEKRKPVLSFVKYCHDVNADVFPDVVSIFLGPNDVFRYTDENIESGIDDMLTHFDQLVAVIRSDSPQTKTAIMLPVPPASTQDAFGRNYRSGQTRWQYKRNQHRLVERMLSAYAKREGEKIYVVPTYVNLDCLRNYPTTKVTANSVNDTKIVRQSNSVHPAASGYRQIGDSLYAWLKSQ